MLVVITSRNMQVFKTKQINIELTTTLKNTHYVGNNCFTCKKKTKAKIRVKCFHSFVSNIMVDYIRVNALILEEIFIIQMSSPRNHLFLLSMKEKILKTKKFSTFIHQTIIGQRLLKTAFPLLPLQTMLKKIIYTQYSKPLTNRFARYFCKILDGIIENRKKSQRIEQLSGWKVNLDLKNVLYT